jgi:hypothetical protein
MSENEVKAVVQNAEAPFPPSWIDRFTVWIDHLPGPGWLFYVLCVSAVAFLIIALSWIAGIEAVGSVDPVNTSFAFFFVYWLALYQYLTRVGFRSLKTFRPLLDVDDSEFDRIGYELAILPRWQGWLAIPIGLGFASLQILTEPSPYYGDLGPQTILYYGFDIAITSFVVSTFYCLIIRSIRQLRIVWRLNAQATSINLLKLEPAHAFSALTARTGIGVIVVLIYGYIVSSPDFKSSLDIFTDVAVALVALAIFVLPLLGMRDRLDKEKERALHRASDMLQVAIGSLHSKVRGKEFGDVGGMEDAINALIRERELLEKISTWPWDPRTIRGFASALVLPIFIWVVTRLLEKFF